ncbi:MAG: RNA polymerase sigma factor [Acidobacteriota bacterium]
MQHELMVNFAVIAEQHRKEDKSLPDLPSLVARAKMGDTDAFEAILIRYQRQVLRTAIRILGNIDDARDAAQEVFLRLHKYLHNFKEEQEFLPWLYRMTVNVCRDIARKRRSTITLSLEQQQESGALDHLSSSHNIEGDIGIAQERKIIAEAMATLSEKERAAIVLRDLEGLDTKEVARLLGSTQTTVRSQISMARLKIKKYRDKILGRG